MTKEQMKQEAIRRLKALGIHKPYINKFVKDNTVTLFEEYAGYYIDKDYGCDQSIVELLQQLQQEYPDLLFYAVEHNIISGYEMYSFLFVSKYKEDWEYEFQAGRTPDKFIVSAYCYNVNEPMFSETGDILVTSFGGGIKRWS